MKAHPLSNFDCCKRTNSAFNLNLPCLSELAEDHYMEDGTGRTRADIQSDVLERCLGMSAPQYGELDQASQAAFASKLRARLDAFLGRMAVAFSVYADGTVPHITRIQNPRDIYSVDDVMSLGGRQHRMQVARDAAKQKGTPGLKSGSVS